MSESDSAVQNSALFEPEEESDGWEYEGQHPALVHVEKFLTESVETRWLVDGILAQNTLAMVFGPPGAGKSFFAIDLGLQLSLVCRVGEYYGRPVSFCECVLYVAAEGGDGVRDRVDGWLDHSGNTDTDDARFFIWNTQKSPLDLLDSESVDDFIKGVGALYSWSLIVIDTLARCFGSGDENQTKDMGAAVASLEKIRAATRACVLVVHHTGKGDTKTARGSNAIKAAINTEIKLTPCESGFRVSCTKQKDAEPFKPFRLDIRPHSFIGKIFGSDREVKTAVVVPHAASQKTAPPPGRLTENRQAALQAVEELWRVSQDGKAEFTVKEFNRRLSSIKPGIAKGSASATLKWMVEQNYLRRPNDVQIEIGSAFEPSE